MSLPQNIFLVIDRSRAIGSIVASLPAALDKALDKLPPTDKVAIVSGGEYPHIPAQLVQPLTADHSLLRSAIRKVADEYRKRPGNLIGGLYESMTDLDQILPLLPKDAASGQTTLVVLSDDSGATPRSSTHGWGAPPQAIHTYDSIAADLEARNIALNLLLPFGNVGSQALRNDNRLTFPMFSIMGLKLYPLESLAKTTGGLTIRVNKSNLPDSIDDLLAQISSRYMIAFTPPEKDGQMHKVHLELTSSARKRLGKSKIVTRHGYLAPDSTHS